MERPNRGHCARLKGGIAATHPKVKGGKEGVGGGPVAQGRPTRCPPSRRKRSRIAGEKGGLLRGEKNLKCPPVQGGEGRKEEA